MERTPADAAVEIAALEPSTMKNGFGEIMPSPRLLAEWSDATDNEYCWGLDAVARELKRLQSLVAELQAPAVSEAA